MTCFFQRAVFAAFASTFGLWGVACAQTPPPIIVTPPPPPLFSADERAALVAYWNAPGRYQISAPPDAGTKGPWQVRLTPEGSQWLLQYSRAVNGAAKTPPTQDAKAGENTPQAVWEAWVAARVARDRWEAQQAAETASRTVSPAFLPAPPGPSGTLPPPVPGPIPPELLAACGNPPVFASAVAPLQFTITFGEPTAETYTYTDNVLMRPRYAYYRFSRGVNSNGKSVNDMPSQELKDLFQSAGLTLGEQHIFEGISKLEGGFDAVQTYDTGYLSVGFIQFVTLAEGKHDLSNALLSERENNPSDYANDFHRYGVDVRPDHTLVVIDPNTGAELAGADAVNKIIDDKRLVAVFQRAGRLTPFRIAQIKVAKSYYWPVLDPLLVTLPDGTVITGTVGDVIHSEAGLATLLDRKINTGNLRTLPDVVARVLIVHKGKSLKDAAKWEREIVQGMKYRTDFLADPTLQQPPVTKP